jgi:TonB family protein
MPQAFPTDAQLELASLLLVNATTGYLNSWYGTCPVTRLIRHNPRLSETSLLISVSNYLVKTRVMIAVLVSSIMVSLSAFGQNTKPNVRISCPLLQSHPLKIVRTTYTELARQTLVEGRVSLICLVGRDGSVERIDVKKGHPLLIRGAMEAVSQWKFKPLRLNGKAVEMETTVNIDFQLPKNQKDTTSTKPHA